MLSCCVERIRLFLGVYFLPRRVSVMFKPCERVVYPGHGVAIIVRVLIKQIGSSSVEFFELKFMRKEMTVLVPVSSADGVGLRPISSGEHIDAMFVYLADPSVSLSYDPAVMNWNKRNKEYQGKLRTGRLEDLCRIYKDLKFIELNKGLSFGEKSLLQRTEALMIEEISLVRNVGHESALLQLRSILLHKQAV
jgi:CarD family transcriptional regulator